MAIDTMIEIKIAPIAQRIVERQLLGRARPMLFQLIPQDFKISEAIAILSA
jgi:hypothetical protein